MTGHGWGEHAVDGHKISVELSSVNRKQSEITVNMPRELDALESRIRDEVNRKVARGRVLVSISLHAMEGQEAASVSLNVPLARAYTKAFRKLAKDLGLDSEVTLDQVLRSPGVVQNNQGLTEPESFWSGIKAALEKGLEQLVQMREREGKHLLKDLSSRIKTMRQAVVRVQKQAPQVQERYRQNLLERIRAAGLDNADLQDDRLHKEVIYFADRSDVSEELTRLRAHFDQFDTVVQQADPVGRTLDFLAQELNREINTLGAKANDSQISREVVLLKTELEKFREQVQNVE